MNRFLVIFLLVGIFSVFLRGEYNGPNRITSKENPAARCLGGVDETSCEERRKFFLDKGCISQEEYNVLKEFGSYPICSDIGYGLKLESWCPCGCFHPDSLISVNGDLKETAEKITFDKNSFQVVHLSPTASLTNFDLKQSSIELTTYGPEKQPMVVINVSNNRTLKLTEKHPVLTSRGMMMQAKDLTIQDKLLSQDGKILDIRSITREKFDGMVVNFKIAKEIDSKLEHVIFAEGVAVGDLAWQSSLEDELNQIIIRQ